MNLLYEKLRACGQHLLRCSDAPDTSGINAAAKANADIASDALAWYKQQYADSAPQRKEASDLALEQARLQNTAAQKQMDTAARQQERYNSTFAPLEDKIAASAEAYDTPARRESAARAASADAEMALDAQRGATMRSQERRGVAPNSGASLALAGNMDLGAAKLKAGAANTARQQVEAVGSAKLSDAAALGRGVVQNSATQAQLALSSGNSSVSNGQVPVNVANAGAQLGGQGFQTAISANNSAGQLYGQAAQLGSSNNDALWGAVGSVAGQYAGSAAGSSALSSLGSSALMALSDKNAKKDKKPVKGEAALRMARRMPVKSWKYRDDSAGADGGKTHIGPMAQDVHAAAGDQAAPGGKVIDLVSMNGITLGAVQALDKKVRRLEKRRA